MMRAGAYKCRAAVASASKAVTMAARAHTQPIGRPSKLAELGLKNITPGISRLSNLVLTSGKGSWVTTDQGQKILDFTSGIGVTNTGHCHPRIVEAAQRQVASLIHGQCSLAFHDQMIILTEKLLEVVPKGLDSFYFWNSGAEAVEAAMKTARIATGKQNVIVFQGSYHGRTVGTMAMTTSKTIYRSRFGPLMPGVYVSPYPYARQLPDSLPRSQLSDYCVEQFELLLHQQSAPEETACAVIEPVLGEGGYVDPPADFIPRIKKICEKHNILLVCDEVQSGFGRTGNMFAVEHFNVVPDILIMAKGLASGFPLSGIVTRKDIMSKTPPGGQGGTYAGNPVSCAAAVATLDVFKEERLLDNARARSRQLRDGLAKIRHRYPIAEIRGLGLMVGIEFERHCAKGSANEVSAQCLAGGMMAMPTSVFEVMRLIPPLTVTAEEIKLSLGILEGALERVFGGGRLRNREDDEVPRAAEAVAGTR
eukprot:Opistho-1_new@101188